MSSTPVIHQDMFNIELSLNETLQKAACSYQECEVFLTFLGGEWEQEIIQISFLDENLIFLLKYSFSGKLSPVLSRDLL